jgi:hypothetical protein
MSVVLAQCYTAHAHIQCTHQCTCCMCRSKLPYDPMSGGLKDSEHKQQDTDHQQQQHANNTLHDDDDDSLTDVDGMELALNNRQARASNKVRLNTTLYVLRKRYVQYRVLLASDVHCCVITVVLSVDRKVQSLAV